MKLVSPNFSHKEFIPAKFSCKGNNVNPELIIEDAPENTVSFVLVMDDPDAPGGTWDHWIVWNITKTKIEENSVPGIQGVNSWGNNKYGGPCPPSGTHKYSFKIYSLDTKLDIPENSRKIDVEKAMKNHILAKSELIGLFSK